MGLPDGVLKKLYYGNALNSCRIARGCISRSDLRPGQGRGESAR